MKSKEEILNEKRSKYSAPYSIEYWNAALEAMDEYSQQQVKNLNEETETKPHRLPNQCPNCNQPGRYCKCM